MGNRPSKHCMLHQMMTTTVKGKSVKLLHQAAAVVAGMQRGKIGLKANQQRRKKMKKKMKRVLEELVIWTIHSVTLPGGQLVLSNHRLMWVLRAKSDGRNFRIYSVVLMAVVGADAMMHFQVEPVEWALP